MSRARAALTPSGEFAVDQGVVNGWAISFCPDDGRFHVGHTRPDTTGPITTKTFIGNSKGLQNARQWARMNEVPK